MSSKIIEIIKDYIKTNPKKAIIIILYIAFLIYKKLTSKDQLKLYFDQNSAIIKEILAKTKLSHNVTSLNFTLYFQVFYPSAILWNGHLMTCWFAFMNPLRKMLLPDNQVRELFVFKDKGTIALDWYLEKPQKDNQSKKPIVAIVPGISSNHNELYLLSLCWEAHKNNMHSVIINYRGAGGVELTSPKLYCASSTDDIREPLEYIYQNYCKDQNVPIFLIGNSLGANISTNYLGEESDQSIIKAAAIVQPPLVMQETRRNLEMKGMGTFYNFIMGKNYMVKVDKYKTQLSGHFQETYGLDLHVALQRSNSLTQYDANVTSIVNGYKDVDEYYDKAAGINKVLGIKIPTFMLMAKDDPLIGEKVINKEVITSNPNILLGVTDHGGHLSYFESFYSFEQWHKKPIFDFLKSFTY